MQDSASFIQARSTVGTFLISKASATVKDLLWSSSSPPKVLSLEDLQVYLGRAAVAGKKTNSHLCSLWTRGNSFSSQPIIQSQSFITVTGDLTSEQTILDFGIVK